MKKILLLAVVCCTLMVAQAQRVYFIYLQSDNGSPFYLKTGDKVYSSSAHGYLIVPQLVDSTYNVVIGKPGLAESRFTIPVNGKDHGYLLRQSGQQLSLFHLQNMTLIEPAAGNSGGVSYIDKTDRFTTLLSKAADDTTLLRMTVFAKTEKAPEPAKTVAKVEEPLKEATAKTSIQDTVVTTALTTEPPLAADTVATEVAVVKEAEKEAAAKEDVKSKVAKAETVKEKEDVKAEETTTEAPAPTASEGVFKRSVVTRRSESSTSEGFGLMFTDSADGVVDTIRIVIPNPRTAFGANDDVAKEVEAKKEARFLDLEKTTATTKTKDEEDKEETQKRKGLFGNKKQTDKKADADEKVAAETRVETNEEKEAGSEEGQKKRGLFGKKEAEKEANITAKERELKKSDRPAASQVDQPAKVVETCKNTASNSDFARLRRSMVGKSTEDDMIGEAQKAFKSRCFTTEQIKTLSSLLLTSNGRYNLFAAAQNHITDKENFRTLQNELWDREDINRFKALLAK